MGVNMSLVAFDCTQFICIKSKLLSEEIINKTFLLFEIIGFDVVLGNDIKYNKTRYLKQQLLSEGYDYICELINKEFVGEYEDWKEINNIPSSIMSFISIIKENMFLEEVIEINLIMIDYASENIQEDVVSRHVVNRENIEEGFFCFSKWNFNFLSNVTALKVIP